MPKINILHLVTTRIDQLYGGDSIILSISRKINKEKFNSMIVCLLKSCQKGRTPLLIKEVQPDKIKTQIIFLNSHLDLSGAWKIKNIIKENSIDIIHCHDYQSNIFAYFCSLICRIKVIATVHGWGGFVKTKRNRKENMHEVIDRWVRKKFDKVVVVSDGLKNRMLDQGYCLDKLKLIYNGIDEPKIKIFASNQIREKFKIDRNAKIVCSVGRLSAEKGMDFFLKVASLVIKNIPETFFVISGDGPQRRDLYIYAQELGIKDKICFTGYVKNIYEILEQIDIFVQSSLWEGFGLALIEAMAMAKAVVTTDVGIAPEIIKSGTNGVMVKSGEETQMAEAIEKLIRNDNQIRQMGESARRLILERFTIDKMASDYAQVYEEIISD